MSERDATQDFLNSLPEIAPGEVFCFACNPGVPCFNACCGDLTLMLTPYDALRLRTAMGLGSEEFLTKRCQVSVFPDTGLPMARLLMNEDQERTCPLVTPAGCSVYQDRPSSCRLYPVGRALRMSDVGEGQEEQFFLIREEHCQGFGNTTEWTLETWFQDQGLEPYQHFNDRFAALINRQKRRGAPIDNRKATMCLLALYQTDRFRNFLRDMKVFDRLEIPASEQQEITSSDEGCLEFALDWLELLLFGENERLLPQK